MKSQLTLGEQLVEGQARAAKKQQEQNQRDELAKKCKHFGYTLKNGRFACMTCGQPDPNGIQPNK